MNKNKKKNKPVSFEGMPQGVPRYLKAGRFFCGGVEMKEINSAAIRAIDAGRDEVDMIATYDHPNHIGNNDWRITLYEYAGGCRVASTNGGAIFEEEDPEQFANLMREYGIE